MGEQDERSTLLPADPRSVAEARGFVATALRDWGMAERVDEAVLAVSEVAGNALRHGRPPLTLHVTRRPDRVVVSVADHDPRCVRQHGSPAPEDAESGRGLALVEAVTDDWGCSTVDDRKQVWFALSAPG